MENIKQSNLNLLKPKQINQTKKTEKKELRKRSVQNNFISV